MSARSVRIAFLVAFSVALPAGAIASCSAVSCPAVAYETFVGRLIARHGMTATYVVTSVVGGEYPTSTAKVGRRRIVRYRERDAAVLRVGRSYRVELNGGGPDIDSSMHEPCSTGTTFTDGSPVVARTWWRRNRVALGIVVVASVAAAVTAVWIGRRKRTRGEYGRFAA